MLSVYVSFHNSPRIKKILNIIIVVMKKMEEL